MQFLRTRTVDTVRYLEFDTTFAQGDPAELFEALVDALADNNIRAVVVLGFRGFWLGHETCVHRHDDIVPVLWRLVEAIEKADKPVISYAAKTLSGYAAEIAFACDARIFAPKTKVSFNPSVTWAFSNTGAVQRLARLMPVDCAASLILQSKSVQIEDTRLSRLCSFVTADPVEQAVQDYLKINQMDRRASQCGVLPENGTEYQAALTAVREWTEIGEVLGGQAYVECLEAAQVLPFEQGVYFETARAELITGSETAQVRRYNHANRSRIRVENLLRAESKYAIALMPGSPFAHDFADYVLAFGSEVFLLDIGRQAVTKFIEATRARFQQLVSRGRISSETAIKRQQRIKIVDPEVCVGAFDLVFDFSAPLGDGELPMPDHIAATLKPDGMFATHHTGAALKERARLGENCDQIVGLSVFAPFRKYETVEILARVLTSESALVTLENFLTKIGKLPIRFNSVRKFKGYRIINAARFAADWLVLSGLSPNLIDLAMIDEGFELGIYPQQDREGLEVCRQRQFNWRERNFALFGYPFVIDPFIEAGRLGVEHGTGIYGYDEHGQIISYDETAQAIISKLQNKEPYNPAVSTWDVATIIKDAMALEAIKMFASGTILDARNFDYMMTASYGIPEHIGGPFYYIDQSGLSAFRERVREYSAAGNVFWYVEPLLDDLIEFGGRASDLRA